MRRSQSKVFETGEADAWFERNRNALLARTGNDWIDFFVSRIEDRTRIASVCEVGCANGWRMERLRRHLAPDVELCGVDPSVAAIADGASRYARLDLRQGRLPNTGLAGPFDLVILSFVLHWVDRGELASAIAEVDRLTAVDGFVIISDFMPDRAVKRLYHHLPGQEVFTYKQDYAAPFLALGLYQEIARVTFPHTGPPSREDDILGLQRVSAQERCASMLLAKSDEGYLET